MTKSDTATVISTVVEKSLKGINSLINLTQITRSRNFVTIAEGIHLFPSRTQSLSPLALTILGGQLPGKIGRRKLKIKLIAMR